jgi:hypothetical protein
MNDKVKPTIVIGSRPKPRQYVAFRDYSYGGTTAYRGTLAEILEEMEGDESDPTDYQFYAANEVKVKYVKKLTLAEEE